VLCAAQFFSSPFSLFLLEHQLANFARRQWRARGRAGLPSHGSAGARRATLTTTGPIAFLPHSTLTLPHLSVVLCKYESFLEPSHVKNKKTTSAASAESELHTTNLLASE
jgi:hypothetical protein